MKTINKMKNVNSNASIEATLLYNEHNNYEIVPSEDYNNRKRFIDPTTLVKYIVQQDIQIIDYRLKKINE